MGKSLLRLLIWGAAVGVWGCTSEEKTDPGREIQASGILEDVLALSSDEMEGRGAGTSGEEKAAAYLERRFREIGLSAVGGSYFQPVKMVGMKRVSERSWLQIRNRGGALEVRPEENLTYWSTSQKEIVEIQDAPLLFVGYGVQAPEYGWDDFKGEDVRGKVLLFLNDDPPVEENGVPLFGGEARTYYGRWTYKFEQAMRLGAAGAFMVHTTPSASYPFSVVQHSGREESFALDLPGSGYQVDLLGWIDEPTSEEIARAMGSSLQELFQRAASRDFRPVDTGFRVGAHLETRIRRLESRNVLGMVKGSDPELEKQVIVVSAHYDHLGKDPNLEGDQIYNGAWDNAAGTACMIHLAKAVASLRPAPRRSVLFLACAAEESGSLGSRWFVENPPFERSRLVANFNIDMPQIFGVTADVAAIGVDTNSLGTALREVASQEMVTLADGSVVGVAVTGDPNPRAGSFYRSDQVNFAKAGIPALFLNPGRQYVTPLSFDPQEYRSQHYHQVSDEVNEAWNLSGAERDMRILLKTLLRVAQDPEMPRWLPGNEFEEEWKKLHRQ